MKYLILITLSIGLVLFQNCGDIKLQRINANTLEQQTPVEEAICQNYLNEPPSLVVTDMILNGVRTQNLAGSVISVLMPEVSFQTTEIQPLYTSDPSINFSGYEIQIDNVFKAFGQFRFIRNDYVACQQYQVDVISHYCGNTQTIRRFLVLNDDGGTCI